MRLQYSTYKVHTYNKLIVSVAASFIYKTLSDSANQTVWRHDNLINNAIPE